MPRIGLTITPWPSAPARSATLSCQQVPQCHRPAQLQAAGQRPGVVVAHEAVGECHRLQVIAAEQVGKQEVLARSPQLIRHGRAAGGHQPAACLDEAAQPGRHRVAHAHHVGQHQHPRAAGLPLRHPALGHHAVQHVAFQQRLVHSLQSRHVRPGVPLLGEVLAALRPHDVGVVHPPLAAGAFRQPRLARPHLVERRLHPVQRELIQHPVRAALVVVLHEAAVGGDGGHFGEQHRHRLHLVARAPCAPGPLRRQRPPHRPHRRMEGSPCTPVLKKRQLSISYGRSGVKASCMRHQSASPP